MTKLNAIKFIGMNLKWKEIFMDQNCSFSLLKIIIIIIIIIVKCCVLGSTIKFNYNFFFFWDELQIFIKRKNLHNKQ